MVTDPPLTCAAGMIDPDALGDALAGLAAAATPARS